jgi:tetratricopeptide (TPR) repeat protein
MIASLFCCYAYAASPGEDALRKGIAFGRQDSDDEALGEFNKAIAANPASADVYYNRGLAYYKKGSYDQAISDYNKVMEIAPGATDALYGRGLAYYKKNDIKQAIVDFNKVIEMRPEFPLAYSARAIAYFAKKNYGQTLADVNKAISLGFRQRPLKEAPEEKLSAAAASPEKSQLSTPIKGSEKSKAWKAKKRLAQIKICTLTALLIACLGAIFILLQNKRNQ